MQVNVEKLSPVLVEVQIEVPADRVRTEVEKAYQSVARTAHVKGYRPGKAPRNVLTHLYGGRIHQDVAQRLVDSTLEKALAEKQVQPLSKPAVAPTELKPESAFSYKVRFEVRPDITEVKWEGFEVKRAPLKVTDDMIDAEITRMRKEHSTLEAPNPERPAQKGDHVAFTFTLTVDGNVREPKDQEMETEVGAGQVFKEIEDVLVGASVGEEKQAELTFSDRHASAELRGKVGQFTITVKSIKERVFPNVDDEFAKDVGAESIDALKQQVREQVEKEMKQKGSDQVAEQLVAELCKANPIPVPPSLVEQQARVTEQELVQQMRRAGQRFDPNPEFRARVRQDAELKVRAGLVMAEIAKAKQVQVTEEDIEKGYVELAEQTGKNVAKIKAEYRERQKRELLIGMILEDKILDLMEAAAKITEEA